MTSILHAQVHYRCAMDLESNCENRDNWKDLVKRVRSWVADEVGVNEQEIVKKWFYSGGQWKQSCPRGVLLETLQARLDSKSDLPKYWSCRLEHPCGQFPIWHWRTDVTITRISSTQFRFILINQRWTRPGYIGKEPDAPPPSVPDVVQALLHAKSWKCSERTQSLSAIPVAVRAECLNVLKEHLESINRECPIVYVSCDYWSGEPVLNTVLLARLLAGTAVVYVAENSAADRQMEELFERDFRCWGGMTRVYQPGVRFDFPADAQRHRFFTREKTLEIRPNEVILQIVQACCRRGNPLRPGDVASVDDVRASMRMHDLHQYALQKKSEDPELYELIALVEKENEALNRQVRTLRDEIDLKDMELEERNDKLRTVHNEHDAYKQSTNEAYEQVRNLETRLKAVSTLNRLPGNLDEVLKMVSNLHSGRIFVLDEAFLSAQNATLENKSLRTAWECLWAVATVLHDLFFMPNQPEDKQNAFEEQTGFELAMTEGKETNKDSKLCNKRQLQFEGKPIDITPHVIWGTKPPKCLRVHFYVDNDKKRLIIGHCGDHLGNYTTQFRH